MHTNTYRLNFASLHITICVIAVLLFTVACEQNLDNQNPVEKVNIEQATSPAESNSVSTDADAQDNTENVRYLFDVGDHSVDELRSLLERAEEIVESPTSVHDHIEFVLILHGPDINLFRKQNYNKYMHLVDLAAKLDAFKIIDMKICETAMSSMGIDRADIPPFIESVPFAPDEIERLTEEGYINL